MRQWRIKWDNWQKLHNMENAEGFGVTWKNWTMDRHGQHGINLDKFGKQWKTGLPQTTWNYWNSMET